MINVVCVAGRLTRDIDTREVNGKTVGNFTLAVDRPYQKGTTDFIDCTFWNAEKLAQYLTKGKGIGVNGSLQIDNFEDKEGNKRKKAYVNVNSIYFLPASKESSKNIAEEAKEVEFDESDLPF